jgi:hypothetical protein
VLFLDGDVVADRKVVETLLGEYHEPRVGAVGGRAVDRGFGSGQPVAAGHCDANNQLADIEATPLLP